MHIHEDNLTDTLKALCVVERAGLVSLGEGGVSKRLKEGEKIKREFEIGIRQCFKESL